MNKSLKALTLFSALLLSGCALLPTPQKKTSSNTSDPGTSQSVTPSGEQKDTSVTSVTLDKSSANVAKGGSLVLNATIVAGSDADKSISWSSSNTSVATVNGSDNKGTVSVSSSASAGQTTKIKAMSEQDNSKYAECTITVTVSETYTILMYVCGSTLESDPSYRYQASGDLAEIISTPSQPNNVNIIATCGGASKWKSTNPGVKSTEGNNETYKLTPNGLGSSVKTFTTHTDMTTSDTLYDFLSWGLKTYKADHYGLIFWNHGGATNGCCFDDFADYYDGLTANEMASAYSRALADNNMSGQKLDWVGYDCCVMSYLDLAAINADYFNYMVSSQELENGTGWDYDAWLPTLYKNPSVDSPTLLKKICDTFVAENGGNSSSNDQTLSVLDLSQMGDLVTAFNTFANGLTNSDWSNLKSAYKSSYRFANISEYVGYEQYGYGLCDMKMFLNNLPSKYNVSSVKTALDKVTLSRAYSTGYFSTAPCGLNIFLAGDDDYDDSPAIIKAEYKASDTKFSNWRSLNINNGSWGK